tara:strand:+ start:17 stop:457 length:441 start_codon:yes stop_codon:yes gene_type:complete
VSPYGLLQEEINSDPWKIFVCCIFCNLTKRVQAEPYFWKVINKWPTPEKLSNAKINELTNLIAPLGLSHRRAKALKKMSNDFMKVNWRKDPTLLFGIGKYGSDAYKIFCTDEWHEVQPKDGALVNYHNWLLKKSDSFSVQLTKKNL